MRFVFIALAMRVVVLLEHGVWRVTRKKQCFCYLMDTWFHITELLIFQLLTEI